MEADGRIRFRLLGPLQVWDGAGWTTIRAAQQRVTLALLLLNSGRVVSMDRLIDELWEESPPATAQNTVQGYVMRVRRAIGDRPGKLLLTRAPGYQLECDDDELDVRVFERLVSAGQKALAAGALDEATRVLSEALGLWAGPALADVPATPALAAEATRLERVRLVAYQDRFDAQLGLGRHAEVVAAAERLVVEHPLREQVRAQLMLALYRCGRRADALAVYREGRRILVDELGLEPGPDLRRLEQAILADDEATLAPPAAPRQGTSASAAAPAPAPAPLTVPAQLPADMANFTGRAHHLRYLDALLAEQSDGGPGEAPGTAMVITAIAGQGGIGKTALAVHWAHKVKHHFSDGQLYVNLRGFDPTGSPLTPDDAIRGFLDAFEIPPQRIPVGFQAQVGLYRSLLAGRRVLIVLDNARDAEQVRPLLPGAAGCLVVVTSRDRLTGLIAAEGARPVALDLLANAEARALLARRLGSSRVAAEPEAVEEIVTRCAALPLALVIVAARAATHPGFPLAALAAELSDARGGLDAFAGEDAATDVRAVFSWSYQRLSEPASRVFRLLGLLSYPDIGTAAVASLAGIPVPRVRPLLAELTRAHLITEHAPGRFALHDLLRAYATEQAHTEDTDVDRDAAIRRVFDHYLHTAFSAALLLDPHRRPINLADPQPGVTPQRLSDHEQALAWFVVEHAVLLAAVEVAADQPEFGTLTWQLAWTLWTYFDYQGHWKDLAITHNAALGAARRSADRLGEAQAHRGLARAFIRLGRYDEAHTHMQLALTLFGELGDRNVQAAVHIGLAWVLERQGRHREALSRSQQALDLFRAVGDQVGEARALNSAGWHHAHLGEYEEAIANCRQALSLLEQAGDRDSQAETWDSLGFAYQRHGEYEQATTCYRHALDYFRDLGDRYGEADTLIRLGDAHHDGGELGSARDAWAQAVTILGELGQPADKVHAKLRQLDAEPQPAARIQTST